MCDLVRMSHVALWAVVLLLAGLPRWAQAHDDASSARVRALEARMDSVIATRQKGGHERPAPSPWKLSAVVQARWETSEDKDDSVRVTATKVSPANTDRFYIKRARLKTTYEDEWGKGVVYLDSGDSRDVDLLEAYVTLYDPWSDEQRHQLTLGQMNVPFGFDLEWSATKQELLERSQVERTLFPGERDRGVKLESRWTGQVHTTIGLFNGTTIKESPDFPAQDPNRNKAFVARVRGSEGPVTAAVSLYDGWAVVPLTGPDVVLDKTRYGADVQIEIEIPSLGTADVRGEFFRGEQLNPDSVSALTAANAGGVFLAPGADPSHLTTDFTGWYITLAQRFATHFQFAARFDAYDPNMDADHDQFERVTLALHAFAGKRIKTSVAYEILKTDRPDGQGGFEDPKDNRWTVQFQHAF